jgi:hypothetical protein
MFNTEDAARAFINAERDMRMQPPGVITDSIKLAVDIIRELSKDKSIFCRLPDHEKEAFVVAMTEVPPIGTKRTVKRRPTDACAFDRIANLRNVFKHPEKISVDLWNNTAAVFREVARYLQSRPLASERKVA